MKDKTMRFSLRTPCCKQPVSVVCNADDARRQKRRKAPSFLTPWAFVRNGPRRVERGQAALALVDETSQTPLVRTSGPLRMISPSACRASGFWRAEPLEPTTSAARQPAVSGPDEEQPNLWGSGWLVALPRALAFTTIYRVSVGHVFFSML